MNAVGLRERKKVEVRERLLDEATRLFLDEDPSEVAIDRLAEAANVSRATFFNYFPTKGALLDELARRMTERLHRYLETLRLEGAPLEESLVRWFALSVGTIRRSEALSRLLFTRLLSGASASELRVAQMAEVHRAYAALVRDAQTRGELSPTADVDFLAEMIAGAMTTLLNNWANDPHYPLEARGEQTARFLASAIARSAPKGTTHAVRRR